jgi:NADH:ubiquinone oxidoreductase subunit F (NADH-binding)/(2Fe-2S) ferredoxin/Pyruvate/2-oxoacid:ferredoxin oxidoreductase delta subunit
MERVNNTHELMALRENLLHTQDPSQTIVRVCLGPGCLALGADKISSTFQEALAAKNLAIPVKPLVKETGCHGFCKQGPLINLAPSDLFYVRVKPEDVEEIVNTTLIKGEVVDRLLYSENGTRYQSAKEVPFYKMQQKIALRNVGLINPLKVEDALLSGAYQAAAKALNEMTPDEIITTIEVSGLRGRGGGGFPTGRKWRSAVRAAEKNPGAVYVICNGDEGDPGAFMDRSIMEGDPHAILEGMIIGAYAVGSNAGYVYVRTEYPFAIRNLSLAIEQARQLGMLGKNILGTGFDFDIQINRGAGAFVCGESTALFTSIEGKPGEPRPKYVRSVERGLWNRPTVLNNVETWANIPPIIQNGGKWYANIGSSNSTGTKAFSLVGKVNNVGLVEVPMGVPLSYIVEGIGGGLPDQKQFKAVQTGGPSGGLIPYELKDLAVDFDTLTKAGSMMGSGGMIVMDQRDCVVDVSRYFLRFLEEESCGKCLPCRLGLKAMLEFLDRFSEGQGSLEDIDELESLARAIMDTSLCALGGSAPNPVLTSIKYFRDEFAAHIVEKKCPAGVCRGLITYHIDPKICNGCTVCARICPQQCIGGEKKKLHTIDSSLCIRCGMCFDECPVDAVIVE